MYDLDTDELYDAENKIKKAVKTLSELEGLPQDIGDTIDMLKEAREHVRSACDELRWHECRSDNDYYYNANTAALNEAKPVFEIARAFYEAHGRVASADEPENVYKLRRVIDSMKDYYRAIALGGRDGFASAQLSTLGVDTSDVHNVNQTGFLNSL